MDSTNCSHRLYLEFKHLTKPRKIWDSKECEAKVNFREACQLILQRKWPAQSIVKLASQATVASISASSARWYWISSDSPQLAVEFSAARRLPKTVCSNEATKNSEKRSTLSTCLNSYASWNRSRRKISPEYSGALWSFKKATDSWTTCLALKKSDLWLNLKCSHLQPL